VWRDLPPGFLTNLDLSLGPAALPAPEALYGLGLPRAKRTEKPLGRRNFSLERVLPAAKEMRPSTKRFINSCPWDLYPHFPVGLFSCVPWPWPDPPGLGPIFCPPCWPCRTSGDIFEGPDWEKISAAFSSPLAGPKFLLRGPWFSHLSRRCSSPRWEGFPISAFPGLPPFPESWPLSRSPLGGGPPPLLTYFLIFFFFLCSEWNLSPRFGIENRSLKLEVGPSPQWQALTFDCWFAGGRRWPILPHVPRPAQGNGEEGRFGFVPPLLLVFPESHCFFRRSASPLAPGSTWSRREMARRIVFLAPFISRIWRASP